MSTLYHDLIPTAPGIYRITCIATGKFYIGSATNLRHRRTHHFNELRRNIHPNQKLQHAWNKYGEQSFIFEILEFVLPISLTAREQYWFNKLKPFGNKGFNIAPTAGSCLGIKLSTETKEKLREAHLGRKHTPEARANMATAQRGRKHTPQTRAKMSTTLMGNTRNLGKKASPEAVAKRRSSNLGQKRSEESRRKMSEWQKGRKLPAETKAKIGLAQRGRTFSPETRAKISVNGRMAKADKMKTLIITDPDGNTYTVTGIRQFCQDHNLDRSTLMRVAKGKYEHHKGWKACFPETSTS